MARIPSTVVSGDPALGEIFATFFPEPERLVYEYLVDAAAWRIQFPQDGRGVTLPADFTTPPTLAMFADRTFPYEPDGTTDSLVIPVVRGWPSYPGEVPGIGVAQGTETEDAEQNAIGGGFAGEVFAYDAQGNIVGTADYFAHPLYEVVLVELVHENRDERDRQHIVLKRILQPLRRVLPMRDGTIKRVQIDAEKQEVEGGPPEADMPAIFYVSVFTVQVWAEMLEATDVRGVETIQAINVTTSFDTPDQYTATDLQSTYDT